MSIAISDVYIHRVEYCETDAMKIVHHSEYIKWMEYSRQQYFLAHGLNWAELENKYGIMMPILNLEITYKGMTKFGDVVKIVPKLEMFNGVFIKFSYTIMDVRDNTIKAIGSTKSGFVDASYHPVILQDKAPEYYRMLVM